MARKKNRSSGGRTEPISKAQSSSSNSTHIALQNRLTPKSLTRVLIAAAIFFLALSLRITFLNNTAVDQPVRADARDYFAYAQNLVLHGVYSSQLAQDSAPLPDSVRPPVYSLYLSFFYRFSDSFQTFYRRVLLSQAFIDSLTVVTTFFIAFLWLPTWASAVSSFLAAINPHLIVMTGYLLSETLFTFFLATAVLSLSLALKREKISFVVLAGALCGMGTLTRSALALFPFLAAGYVWYKFRGRGTRRAMVASLALTASFLVVLSPWLIRNALLENAARTELSMSRNSFVHGSYPNFTHRSKSFYGYPYREDPQAEQMYRSWSDTFSVLAERVKSDPIRYLLWYGGGKIVAFWGWDLRPGGYGDVYSYPYIRSGFLEVGILEFVRGISRILHWPMFAVAHVILIFYLYKALSQREETPGLTLCVLLILYFSAVHTVLAPFPRYSIPLRPYLFIIAMTAVSPGIFSPWKRPMNPA